MIIGIVLMILMFIFTAGLFSYGLGDPPASFFNPEDPFAVYDVFDPFAATNAIAGFAVFYIIYSIWGLANFIPGLAIGIRRLHDIGKSWVYILFGLIPLAGAIILIVFYATEQKHAPENEFAYLKQV